MFNSLIKRLSSLFGIEKKERKRAASAPVKKLTQPQQSRKHRKNSRRPEDASVRPAPKKGNAPVKSRKTAAPSPKAEKKTAVRTIPPMPELIPPPEEPPKLRFFDLELCQEVLAATQTLGFHYCTEIQKKCLPYAIAGRDLAGKAQTGTGKTAAFLAALITKFVRNPKENRKPGTCRALVLSPTRELAVQIHEDAEALSKYTNLNNLVIFGGMDHKGQRDSLAVPVDILVGTPGRIIDYSRSGDLDLSQTEILVIDEADRMLDMGFIPDVRRIVSKLPGTGKRQTMLFSATLEPEVLRLVDSWLKDPVSLESEPEHVVTDLIDQHFYAVLEEQKLPFLLNLIKTLNPERMIIFGNRKDKNRRLVSKLYAYGIDAELLSGDVAQEKRLKILDHFRSGHTKILVATDVAARGIHVDGISHVVNYDLPEQPDDYVHRVGRTGRAGAKGQSISFVCEFGAFVLPDIEKYAGMEIKTVQPEEAMLVMPEQVRKELKIEKPRHTESFGHHSGGGRKPPFRGRR